MKQKSVAVVGAAETTELGVIPGMSQIQLHADAALNAMADCGLKPSDIDGIATAGGTPMALAQYLGITPSWADGTAVGTVAMLAPLPSVGGFEGGNLDLFSVDPAAGTPHLCAIGAEGVMLR